MKERFNVVFDEGIMSATEYNDVWGGGNIFEKCFEQVDNGLMVVGLVVFFDGVGETRAREKFDVLAWSLIFLNEGFDAV